MIYCRTSSLAKILLFSNFKSISQGIYFKSALSGVSRTLKNMASVTQHIQIGSSQTRKVAYNALNYPSSPVTVVFVNGFMSTKEGTKAEALSTFCQDRGINYVRFDFEGIGESAGDIKTIQFGDWIEDLQNVMDKVTKGPVILIGSSMGGWISLKCAIANASRIRSMILIAPALNFIRPYVYQYYEKLSAEDRVKFDAGEAVVFKNQYGTVYLRKDFADNTKEHELHLKEPIPITVPIRILHGMKDPDVPYKNSLHLASLLESDNVDILFRKNGRHQLSEPEDLKLLMRTVDELLSEIEAVSKL